MPPIQPKYDPESKIHYIDYSGRIDLQEGLALIELLDNYFSKFAEPGHEIKVLMLAKEYEKDSPETHDKLAQVARERFSKYNIKLAVLDAKHKYILSEKEAWFTDLHEAEKWLS